MSLSQPPRPGELEVSIIGPGRGECILLHLGDNEWCVIDSCIARGHSAPVAVEYLRGFQNDALNRVKLIVATHWHDDHIRGLATMLNQSPAAIFSCSSMLDEDTFRTLVGFVDSNIQGRSGVDEFAEIVKLLERRREVGMDAALFAPSLAIANRRLLKLSGPGRTLSATVTALSPSDTSVVLGLRAISQLLPKAGEVQRRIVNRAPNHTSIVLWVEAGRKRLLLGADLEHSGREGEGWLAVLASHQDANPAEVFKVPHHGSENADCPEVWTDMLSQNPVAVVTSFAGRLPQDTDLTRLSARTTKLYCTSKGPGRAPPRDRAVERELKRIARERRVVEGQPGHVRIRYSMTDDSAEPVVELFNGAYQVTSRV